MTVVTTLSPVVPGQEGLLACALRDVQRTKPHPMGVLGSTHFARYVVIDSLGRGPADLGRHVLASTYLLFSAAFDADRSHGALEDAYFRDLCAPAFAATADGIWGHCAGYPGTGDPEAFGRYLRACSLPTRLVVPGYKETLPEVRSALRDQRRVTEFALRARDLPDRALAAEVAAFLTGGQDDQ